MTAVNQAQPAMAPVIVHVLSQEDQPYGSARRCCNHCGVMIWGAPLPQHVDNWTDWRAHPNRCGLPRAPRGAPPSTQKLHATLTDVVEQHDALIAMLDELAAFRARERLRADPESPVSTDDLPPDAATGIYLDHPFDGEDFAWIKMAFDMYLVRGDGGPKRAAQLSLVFEAIRRDERASAEFLRLMNTAMLPLLRRLRLKEHPHLTKLGAAGE